MADCFSGQANCIFVVVDKLTKYAHFLPLHHPFTAAIIARVYLDNNYKLHGLPNAIKSDPDRIFNSAFWQELFLLAGVELHMSFAYHSRIDGQTECINQCLETYLRCFVHACPSKWSKWLSVVEFWYNTSFHSSLGCSPFEVLYGHLLVHFGIDHSTVLPRLPHYGVIRLATGACPYDYSG